jgi:hypothetical protein
MEAVLRSLLLHSYDAAYPIVGKYVYLSYMQAVFRSMLLRSHDADYPIFGKFVDTGFAVHRIANDRVPTDFVQDKSDFVQDKSDFV